MQKTKTKKQNHNILVWQDASEKQWNFLIWTLFILAAVFAWWFYVNLIKTSWELNAYYLSFGSQAGLSMGTASAVANNKANTQVSSYTRRLDGIIVEQAEANYVPYAVMIENLLSVRPQSGLSQAAVVYETLVEGGATRFMAVFDPSEVIPEIMPVRSARAYYLEWASEYGALYAHAGGSPIALNTIRVNEDINDLEALSSDAKYFWRDTTKYAPHNLVTSSEKMNFALRDKELKTTAADYTAWKFKDGTELAERGEDGRTASFNFSYGLTYKTDWQYRQEDNVYLRFNGDRPHLDKNTNEQITSKNVVIQLVEEPTFDGTGKGRLNIFVGGEGQAWIFRDGRVIKGKWQKASRTDRTLFYDLDGNEIEFNRGNTWVHVLPKEQAVTYE